MRSFIIAVVGYANLDSLPTKDQEEIYHLAFNMGKTLVDNDYIIVNGGLGGVMEAVSEGGTRSHKYTRNSIIGIIPNYDKSLANPYVDIALPIGFDLARNVSVASIGDAMIVIGGGSGTLSEISLAWQMGKLIIALGDYGFGGEFKNRQLDSRRNDKIYFATNPNEVLTLLRQKLPYQQSFSSITKIRTQKEAKSIITSLCKNADSLNFLGKGNEGFVFHDNKHVYKLFHRSNLYLHLQSISDKLKSLDDISFMSFEVCYHNNILIITYPYVDSSDFIPVSEDAYLELLSNFYYSGIVFCDMQPKNLRVTKGNKIFMCDIGQDLLHFSDSLFESMCRRVFAIYKLQDRLNEIKNIKTFLSPLNATQNFEILEKFLASESLTHEYKKFRHKIGVFALHKKLIIDFYAKQSQIKTIFDYGAGSGAIAYALKQLDKKVAGYEVDRSVMKQKYYKMLDCSLDSKESLQSFLHSNEKFDSVLCSLVLCHPLAQDEEDSSKIIEEIMNHILCLSNKHVLIVICNPLFIHANSSIQRRESQSLVYNKTHKITKYMYSTQRCREDYHRPLGFYENLFAKFGLEIQAVFQSGDCKANHYKISNSDFLFFSLVKA